MNSFLAKLMVCIGAIFSLCLYAIGASAEVQKIILKNDKINAEITPDIGGRLLSIALHGKPNFLRVGEPVVNNPHPQVSAEAENVGYLGHEIWVGPQSEWWIRQSLNAKRAAEKSVWPPDPYLVLAKNSILENSANKIILLNPASPVSGVELTKTYSLNRSDKNSLQLDVLARNARSENIAWDIWFNTRVYPDTKVYVPIASISDINVKNLEDEKYGALKYTLIDGLFSLDIFQDHNNESPQKPARKGKIMLQPSQGWMAGFRGDQVLIIQFAHQEKSAIHAEQGQIELYSEYFFDDMNNGLLEMEVHAPYRKLAPSETMSARETWTILEYKGSPSANAQIEFLRKHVKDFK